MRMRHFVSATNEMLRLLVITLEGKLYFFFLSFIFHWNKHCRPTCMTSIMNFYYLGDVSVKKIFVINLL